MLSMLSSFQKPNCGAMWHRCTLSRVSEFAYVVVALLPGTKLVQKCSSSVVLLAELDEHFMSRAER